MGHRFRGVKELVLERWNYFPLIIRKEDCHLGGYENKAWGRLKEGGEGVKDPEIEKSSFLEVLQGSLAVSI